MRNNTALLVSALFFFCSCADMVVRDEPEGLTLSISLEGIETKATSAGVNSLNENRINTIDVFLYKNGEDDAKIYTQLTVNNSDFSSDSRTIKLSGAELTRLGSSGFKVFALANVPENMSISGKESVAVLQSKALSSSTLNEIQDSFVMSSELVTASGSAPNFNASIHLKRVACKFAVNVTATEQYNGYIGTDAGPWTPDPTTATVKLYGVASDGNLGGDYHDNATDFETLRAMPAVYYSYPTKPLPENKPYYIIKMPWNNGSKVIDTYYKVMCDYESFEANCFYKLDVDITMAGSATEPEPVNVRPEDINYRVSPWRDGVVENEEYHTEAVIKDARYLVVPQESYTMENLNSIEIPFTSSHTCTVTITSKKWTDFSGENAEVKNLDTYSGNTTVNCVISGDNHYFTLTHTLNNDFIHTSTYDVCPFSFEVTIQHSDNSSYKKVIRITQKPAISIEADNNKQNTTSSWGSLSCVNRYINGSLKCGSINGIDSNLGGSYNPEGLAGTGIGGNQTWSMFIITISALPEDSPYILGDPRTDAPQAWGKNDFFGTGNNVSLASGKDIDGNSNIQRLDYYYPTREDGSADNVVAPSICTASALSRCSGYSNTFEVVRRRCAVYQEKGRPAGRWRLLTKAEAKILAKLNKDGKIPDLFSDSNNFLVAGGYAMNDGSVVGTQADSETPNWDLKGSVRPCYDEWYWKNTPYPTCELTTFTWGDLPR